MKQKVFTIGIFVSTLFVTTPAFCQKLKLVMLGQTGKSISTVPFEMSIKKGHFRNEGLDVKSITIRQSDIIIKAILTNEVSFMSIIPTAILASVRGLPIRTIAVNMESAPYVLVGRPQIKSMSELKGKKVATSSIGGMSSYVVREIVARNGLDPDRDLALLAVGGSEARTAALMAGFVDAALVVAPFNYNLERQGYTRLVWGPDFVRYPLNGVAASADFLANNRDFVVAFLRGVAGGVREVKQRRSEMIAFVKEYLDLPEEEAVKSYEFLVSSMPDNMVTDDAIIRKAMEFAGHALQLKPEAVPDISKVRDWSFARAVKW